MKRKKELPPMTQTELMRHNELEMYILIEHVFKVMGDKITTYEFIELICTLSGASISLIKTVISNMRAINSTVKPYKDELAVMLYRSGMPVSKICTIAKTTPNTVYDYIESYYDIRTREYLPRVKLEFHEHIAKFTKLLKELLTYDEHRI